MNHNSSVGMQITSNLFILGMFLQAIFSAMDKLLNKKSTKKVFLYFAHDINIVHVLRALNLVDTIKPGFGAYVNFELHSNERIKVNIFGILDKYVLSPH